MEDYGNRLNDYVNGHEQDDDDGDVEGDFCYGIHECIRRRMRGNKPTDIPMKHRSLRPTPSSRGCVETQSQGTNVPGLAYEYAPNNVTWRDDLFPSRN